MLLTLHILAGLLSLVAGAVALFAAKGQRLHRRSGLVFAGAMLFMSASGTLLATMNAKAAIAVFGGLLTFYMVATGVLTVRRPVARFAWIDSAAMVSGVALGLYGVLHGAGLLAAGKQGGIYVAFGVSAMIGAHGDWRVMSRGALQGAQRIARHLWRMCFAMFMATSSFFLGQAKLFPAPVRQSQILAIPVLIVVLAMLYWLGRTWRTRSRRTDPLA
jgi:uncharacterized membrane protein